MNDASNLIQLNDMVEIHEFFFQANDQISMHCCLWGDFNFSLDGILQLQIGDALYLAPPNYGLWLPPQTEHSSIAIDQQITHFICIRIHPYLANKLSQQTQTLVTRPFFHALVKEALRIQHSHPQQYQHLLQVIYDQICMADCYDHYLPQTSHPVLQPILAQLNDVSNFQYSIQQILAEFRISERHLLRLSQQELKLPISEWRNRAKIIHAVCLLKQGQSIKQIAYLLGFRHSSSFIAFFRRYLGKTPAEMRLER